MANLPPDFMGPPPLTGAGTLNSDDAVIAEMQAAGVTPDVNITTGGATQKATTAPKGGAASLPAGGAPSSPLSGLSLPTWAYYAGAAALGVVVLGVAVGGLKR